MNLDSKYLFNIFIICILSIKSNGQVISNAIINNGGGSSTVSAFNLEWSIGESVSIAYFTAPGFTLSTGILQPMTTIVTSINEYGPAVFGTQITIGPNPTSNILHFKASFNQVGNLAIQLIDSKSTIFISHEAGLIYSSFEKEFSVKELPSGIFYVRVVFKTNNGRLKTGVYKIIKI